MTTQISGTGADKAAVVAGGSAGVGYAVVEALVGRGYRVGVIARGDERLAEMRARFSDAISTETADVAKAEAVSAAARNFVGRHGAPVLWVNAAMLTAFSPFMDMPPDEFEAITAACYHGQVNGVRAALGVMEKGAIVNVGSGLSYRSVPFQSAYCGAKHAINGFTSAVRSEILRESRPITLSLVQLPAINTPQFSWARNRLDHHPQPAPPIYQPEVAGRAVLKAADEGAREILVGRSVLQLVAGQMLLPDWLDRKLARDGAKAQQTDQPQPGFRSGNLDGPVEREASAHGEFGDRARDTAVIVDGDRIRKIAVAAGAGLCFAVGLALG